MVRYGIQQSQQRKIAWVPDCTIHVPDPNKSPFPPILSLEVKPLAVIKKYPASAVRDLLRHNSREIVSDSNPDIDPERSENNYELTPDHGGISSYAYYKQRMGEVYCYNRPDVKTICGCIVTAPKDLAPENERDFFQLTTDFLCDRYGVENAVQAIVHTDEKGRDHLHFLFMPCIPDAKHGGEKICSSQLITPWELQRFHPDLQKYLQAHGCNASVMDGAVARQNGVNYTVAQLKAGVVEKVREAIEAEKRREIQSSDRDWLHPAAEKEVEHEGRWH